MLKGVLLVSCFGVVGWCVGLVFCICCLCVCDCLGGCVVVCLCVVIVCVYLE